MEQQSLGSGADHMLALPPSTDAAFCSEILQSEDYDKKLQRSTADCEEEPGFTAFDEQMRAKIHLNVMPNKNDSGKEREDSLAFKKWPISMQRPNSHKRKLGEMTVEVDSAVRRLRRPCASKISTAAQTWRCCCGRSVFNSPCTSTFDQGGQWSAKIEQGSAAGQSAVIPQSPAAVSRNDTSTLKMPDETERPRFRTNRMEVSVDPASITNRGGLQNAMPRQESGNHVLASEHAFGINAACLGHAHSPFAQAAHTNTFFADTQDIGTDYSPVAYFTNRNAPTFVTPSNQYDGNSGVASSFNLQTPSTRQYVQLPELRFVSSSGVEETPPFIVATPLTTDTGYRGLPRCANMFGDAAQKIHFGTDPVKSIRMIPGQEGFNPDFDLVSAAVADSSFDINLFAH